MFASSRILMRATPSVASKANHLMSVATKPMKGPFVRYSSRVTGHQVASFSSVAIPKDSSSAKKETGLRNVGSVTKNLRALDMNVVKEILSELKSVDANSDGRLDADELKQLLRRHDSAFTEEEIVEIGELFYAGKGGGSVSFDRFVEALDRVAHTKDIGQDIDPWEENSSTANKDPLQMDTCANEYIFVHNHHWTEDQLDIKLTHTPPEGIRDKLAFQSVKGVRFLFDKATGWNGVITPNKILNRAIFLETIAAVPGMVAAIVRHFRSLRTMKRDGGMMQMFLDEANNERMHLLSFVRMRDPNMFFRASVIGAQLGFGSAFLLAYVISPKFCHRFVGYIEEEACATYTKIIKTIEEAPEDTELGKWRSFPAPKIARSYWHLGEHGTVLDMIYSVRADEAEHRDVNHLCSNYEEGMLNPVSNSQDKINLMLLKYVKDIMNRTPEDEAAAPEDVVVAGKGGASAKDVNAVPL